MNRYKEWLSIIILLALLVIGVQLLTGCAKPQEYAGIIHLTVKYSENGYISEISGYDGKEEGLASLAIVSGDTSVTLNLQDVLAFQGQESRAAIEQALAEQGIDPNSEIVGSILAALAGIK